MKITEEQMPEKYRNVIADQIEIFNSGRSIEEHNLLPETPKIPIKDPRHWLKIPDVICVYVDMMGSTKLSASLYDQDTAGAYQLFTGTAVRLFASFDAPYIDVRGDGVFALFNSDQPYRAIAAAVTFKTFAAYEFAPIILDETSVEVGNHIGIDQKTVLVRKIGFMRYGDRTDRQNEVWAGKPVNMAAKLAALSADDELLVSERYFNQIQNELVIKSCGCPSGEKHDLWTAIDVAEDARFDFDIAYRLGEHWCRIHGAEFCESILSLDDN